MAYALSPLVERLSRTRLSRPLSVAAVFLGLFVVFGLGAWFLEGKLAGQVQDVQQNFPQYKQAALDRAGGLDQKLAARHVHFSLTDTIQHPPAEFKTLGERAGKDALPLLRRSFTDAAEAVIVLLIALYFLIFAPDMREKFNGMLPADLGTARGPVGNGRQPNSGRVRQRTADHRADHGRGGGPGVPCYRHRPVADHRPVRSRRVPDPRLRAIYRGCPRGLDRPDHPTHIPNPVVAAIAVVVLFVVINEVGGKVLYPKLVGSALGLHEVVVLFVLFAGLEINGIVGTLFAAPVAALAIVTMIHLYRLWSDLPDDLISNANRREARQR